MAPAVPDPLLLEALFYAEWLRGAGGRWMPGEVEPAAAARPATAAGAPSEAARAASQRLLRPREAAAGRARGGGAPAAPAARVAPPEAPPDPARWGPLQAEVEACRRCALGGARTQAVFGSGSRTPRLVVVGEAPGAEEDEQGLPFVGASGQLLTRMLAAIGLSREHDVYILNLLKCRPPGNRPPLPAEVAACAPWLREQLALLGPPPILALGAHAARALLATERGISSLRGSWMRTPEGWRVMPTYHPSYLLRTPEAKREAWLDLQAVQRELGLR